MHARASAMSLIQHSTNRSSLVVAQAPTGRVSEEEFLAWCADDVRAEWVDGRIIVMSPASKVHARLARFLTSVLGDFVDERELGEVLATEYQARLNPAIRRTPDVLFVSEASSQRLLPQHLEGPPDLAMEIVSPESIDRDWHQKYSEYQAAGVREYWIIDPMQRRVEAHTLSPSEHYQPIALEDGRLLSSVVPGFYLRPEWLWRARPPKVSTVLKELLGL